MVSLFIISTFQATPSEVLTKQNTPHSIHLTGHELTATTSVLSKFHIDLIKQELSKVIGHLFLIFSWTPTEALSYVNAEVWQAYRLRDLL